jgi:hypothetical protein
MRSASARAAAAAALAVLTAAVPAGGAVLGSARPHAAAEPPPGWVGGTLRTATGESVTVHVSTSYAAERVAPQAWAEFFAGLPHGRELASLVVRIAPPAEVATLCGDQAVGCYGARELVMPGEPFQGTAPEQVARHEYGHHIAASRSNPPWRAADWGPKRWASAARICRRSKEGTAYPGDDGSHYRLDPGEAFAEAYRVLAEQRAGAALASWGLVDGSFYPDGAALQAVEQDVARPWTQPTPTTLTVSTRNGDPRRRLVPVATPLDGELVAELRLPQGRLDTLELLSPDGRALARGLWSGTRNRRLSFVVCGQRRLMLRLTSIGSPGRSRLTVSRP